MPGSGRDDRGEQVGAVVRTLLTALLTGYGVSTGGGTEPIISRTV